jgi:glycosyltransferase involved in cell wall biosynthesis
MTGKSLLVLYHENVSVRFPAHYRLPFLKYLRDWGYEVRFIAFSDQDIHDNRHQDMVCLPKYKASRLYQVPLEYMRTYLSVRKAITHMVRSGFEPDLVVSFNHPVLSTLGEKYSHKYHANHVIHIGHLMVESKIRSEDWVTKLKGYGSRMVRNRQLKRADQVWVMSEEMKRYFSDMLDPKKIKVWPSAVSAEVEPSVYAPRAEALRKKLGVDPEDRIVIYIGTLGKKRGLEFVLNAFKMLLNRMANVKLVFVGYALNSEDLNFLRKYAGDLEIQQHIIFHPPVDEDELPYYIKMADVGISPFKPNFVLRHNSPLKLLEYFKAGIPVVATEIPEQQVVVAESQAGMLAKWEENAFAEAIIAILSANEAERNSMGQRGYDWVKQNRDIEKLTREMLQWFEELSERCH